MPVALASMTLLPWWQAALYNFVGSAAGAVCAFFIARRFRVRAVAYFTPLQKILEWQRIVSARRQFWTFVAFRFVSFVAFDFVVYAIGLTSISFRKFVATLLIVDLPVAIVFFYIGGIALGYGIYIFIAFMLLLFLSGLILRYKSPF